MKKTSKNSFDKVISNIIDACPYIKITIRLNTNKINYEEIKRLSKFLLDGCKLKNKVQLYLAEIKNYRKEKVDDYYCAGEFLTIKTKFNKYLFENHLTDKYKISAPPSFEPNFCGIIKKHNYAIGPKGELYKCEHYFGNYNKVIGDIYHGLYYNEEYKKFMKGNSDFQCESCELSPCCRSDCQAMYECHKQNGRCLIYNDLLKNLKHYIKEYILNVDKI